jgi:AraC-like DNA-binding protein
LALKLAARQPGVTAWPAFAPGCSTHETASLSALFPSREALSKTKVLRRVGVRDICRRSYAMTSAGPSDLLSKQQEITRELSRFRARALEPADTPSAVREVLRFIHEHLFEPSLNVKTVRISCKLRNHNISTQFRRTVGIGIREYIEALRMDAARCLLLNQALEIYLVAVAIGYDCQETFCRAFQRHCGCTASAYRRRPLPTSSEP